MHHKNRRFLKTIQAPKIWIIPSLKWEIVESGFTPGSGGFSRGGENDITAPEPAWERLENDMTVSEPVANSTEALWN